VTVPLACKESFKDVTLFQELSRFSSHSTAARVDCMYQLENQDAEFMDALNFSHLAIRTLFVTVKPWHSAILLIFCWKA
jgi:hypothetical protein